MPTRCPDSPFSRAAVRLNGRRTGTGTGRIPRPAPAWRIAAGAQRFIRAESARAGQVLQVAFPTAVAAGEAAQPGPVVAGGGGASAIPRVTGRPLLAGGG